MVFESVVAELLNKFLGEYIENLDYSQLKLSLWGGDVVLNDLLIKESALDILDLPIKLDYGRLAIDGHFIVVQVENELMFDHRQSFKILSSGDNILLTKCKASINIKFDMWNGQIDAVIEELFILIVPTSQVKYDAEKEIKAQLEAKRAEIARVERNKQLAEMKNQEKIDDSMMEKLIARMIKNIHLEINRIHVRYEDKVTFKEHPFSIGFTLNRLALESCDCTWSTTGKLKDMYAIQQIFKLCTLDGLAAYLNPTPKQFSSESKEKYLQIFSESIATAEFLPEDYQYVLGPINVMAKLKLNPKPETDGSSYTIPKVFLDLEMQKLKIALTKRQYQTLMQMGEGLDRAQKAAPFRKYRPNLSSYHGHYKEWYLLKLTTEVLFEQLMPDILFN